MKFLVDAHLPRRMSDWLKNAGFGSVHTLDLPDKNKTTDKQILEIAAKEERVVVTKDADFVNSHLLLSQPSKLLLISTGNITNIDLEKLFIPAIPTIAVELETSSFVELNCDGVIIRG